MNQRTGRSASGFTPRAGQLLSVEEGANGDFFNGLLGLSRMATHARYGPEAEATELRKSLQAVILSLPAREPDLADDGGGARRRQQRRRSIPPPGHGGGARRAPLRYRQLPERLFRRRTLPTPGHRPPPQRAAS